MSITRCWLSFKLQAVESSIIVCLLVNLFCHNYCAVYDVQTPAGHNDLDLLEQAVELVEKTICEVDRKTGEAKCRFLKERLDFLDDKLVRD